MIRIEVPDAGHGAALIRALAYAFDGEALSLDGDRLEVCIERQSNQDRAIVLALDTLEGWLLQSGVESARVHVDGHSYVMRAPGRVMPLDDDSGDRRVFRQLNEELEVLAAPRLQGGASLFVCECDEAGCAESVEMTSEEFRAVRARGGFVVAPGHARDERDEVASARLSDE
jgi:hypothetical protein